MNTFKVVINDGAQKLRKDYLQSGSQDFPDQHIKIDLKEDQQTSEENTDYIVTKYSYPRMIS